MQEDDGPSRQMAVDAGNTIIQIGKEEAARWREAAQPTIDRWIAEMDERGMDGSALRARSLELIEQNSN